MSPRAKAVGETTFVLPSALPPYSESEAFVPPTISAGLRVRYFSAPSSAWKAARMRAIS